MDDEPVPSPSTAGPTPFSSASPQAAIFPQSTGSGFQPQPQRTLSPQPTGSFQPQQQQQQRSLSPQATGSQGYALQGTIFPQATGQSAQGARSLTSQATGGFENNFGGQQQQSQPAQQLAQPPQQTSSSFFDDNDDADTHASLSAATVQLASLKSSHTETTQAVTSTSTTRAELEQQLLSTTREINELQVSLSTARAAHEAERTMVDELRKKNEEQKALLVRARTELITAESDLSALRVERTEIEGGYLRDKEEVRECKRRLGEVGAELQTLKATLEKVKKEARQQRGLVAISKKQVVTAEGEREKVDKELRNAERDAANPSLVKQEEDDSPFDFAPSSGSYVAPALAATAPAAVAAALPLPRSNVVSPAASVRSTNPFDRLGATARALEPQQTGGSTVAQPALSRKGSEVNEPHVKTEEAQPATSTARGIEGDATSTEGGGITGTMAAVAGGAVAAAGAVGAGVASLWNAGDDKQEHETKQEEPVASTSNPKEVETDPFGLPIALGAATSSDAAFESSFGDDGFGGDDFGTSVPPSSSSVAAPDSAEFDNAFSDVEQPAAPTDGPFTPADHDKAATLAAAPVQDTPVGVRDESAAGAAAPIDGEEASTDLTSSTDTDLSSSIPAAAAAGPTDSDEPIAAAPLLHRSGAESDSENVFDSPAAQSQAGDDEDSSDDENEVEDAGPSRYTSASAKSVGGEGGEEVVKDSPVVATSTSDSGESFVHVPSTTDAPEEESSMPTSEQPQGIREAQELATTTNMEEPTSSIPGGLAMPGGLALPVERGVSPGSEQDTFEDANAGSSAEPASPTTIHAPAPLATELPIEQPAVASPAVVSPTTHRRAAPPPPTSRSGVPVPAAVPSTSSSSAFDDAFGEGPASSSSAAPPSSGNDAFDSAFDDLGPSVAASSSSPFGASTAPTSNDFNDSFDFDDGFNADFPETGPSQSSASTADFESSFADFDSSPASGFGAAPASPAGGAFGAPSSLGAPLKSAPDDEVKEDDVAGVKQIVGMGFNRQQAIEALENSNVILSVFFV